MSLKLNSIVRSIMFAIAQSSNQQLHMYTIFSKFRLPLKDILRNINTLISNKFLSNEGDLLKITKLGLEWIDQSKVDKDLWVIKEWRTCPEEFKELAIKINSFYVPLRQYLDKSLL